MYGSSPLARGTLVLVLDISTPLRLIPARAGNMENVYVVETKDAAHPRSRGEHPCRAVTTTAPGGSSPLARGTFSTLGRGASARRLIPARAGNIGRCSP